MNEEYEKLKDSLVSIASESFRFQRVFVKVISKLEVDEQTKYSSRYEWFSKKLMKALDDSNLRVISVDGQPYDPGMAVTPLNLEDFEADDVLYKDSLVSIASESFRFQRVFVKVISKLEVDEQTKYSSRYEWFSKKLMKALDDSNLRVISVDGQPYDPGMAVTPLNLEDFEADDVLYVEQTMEPIIMEGDTVIKTGTVLLGRKAQ